MHVLIAGATGFIGRLVVDLLRDRGIGFTVWTRDPARARQLFGSTVACVAVGDGPSALRPTIEQADAVINLAGESIAGGRWTNRRKQQLSASRVGVTAQLATVMARYAPSHAALINASAVGFYGDRGDELLDEQSTAGSGFLAELCVAWEHAVQPAVAKQLRVSILRFGVVLGPNGGALQKMLPVFRAGLGGPLGTGRQYLSWIHSDDAAAAIIHVLNDETVAGPVNIVAPQPAQNREFARALGRALRRPALMRVPRLALKAALGDASEMLLASQRVQPSSVLMQGGFRFQFDALASALENCIQRK